MAKFIPFVNGAYGPTRSTTTKNLDTLFSAITALVNFYMGTAASYVNPALGRIYFRALNILFGNPTELISHLKRATHWYINIVRGTPIEDTQPFDGPNDFFSSRSIVGVTPNSLLYVRNLVKSGAPNYLSIFDQLIFALLSLHRVIVLPPVLNFDTITSPSDFSTPRNLPANAKVYTITDDEIRTALVSLGIDVTEARKTYKRLAKAQNHIIMSSAGPNGKASWSAYSDAVALLNAPVVFKYLTVFAEQSGLSRFINHLLGTVRIPAMDNQEGGNLYTARIHTFEEWGGKTRNVAVVDYWSQLLLTPLHDLIFSLLRNIPMDATFDQDAAAKYIQSLTTNDSLELYSVDLSAATDRLPRSLQQRVLAILLGNDTLADAWVRIFSERLFHTQDNQLIKYAIGLPMGSKSNWAMLALTHHIIVKVAANRAKLSDYTMYRICGDDVVLSNSSVYIQYSNIMSWYYVTINETKSILHIAGLLPAAEFCKRVFVNGVELTLFPVKLIVKTVFNGRLLPQLQNELTRRGISISGVSLFDVFAAFVDRESLEFIMILNAMPRSISGLHTLIRTGGIYHNRSNWFGNTHVLTARDLIAAYTYVLVTEQLKRLDALLRQSEIIAQAIEAKTGGWVTPQYANATYTMADGSVKPLLEAIGWKHPEIEWNHPIAHAAFVEVDRINNLLSNLRTSDAAVSTAALSSLLDAFRNALVDVWADATEARAQAERSLVTRAMSTLGDLIGRPTVSEDGKTTISRRLEFTISLSYIGRVWSVTWELGSDVQLNAVKSRILTSAPAATVKASTIASSIDIQSRFLRGTAIKKTVAPSANVVDIGASS